jgi:hypothetical protein
MLLGCVSSTARQALRGLCNRLHTRKGLRLFVEGALRMADMQLGRLERVELSRIY